MVGLILLVLISIAVYLVSGPLPRISPEGLRQFRKITSRPLSASTGKLVNSEILRMLWVLHTDLLAGLTLQSSISRAVRTTPSHLLPLTRMALADQTDLVDSLYDDSLLIDNQIFSDLIKVLQVTSVTGSSAQGAIKRLIERVQIEQKNTQLVASELAGTKATVLVLACLPALGMLMSAGLGINPIAWLIGNPAGLFCLLIGLSLEIIGLAWVKLLINRATSVGK